MKVILQSFEPMPQPFASANAPRQMAIPQGVGSVRKPKLRLVGAVSDVRLFHAL